MNHLLYNIYIYILFIEIFLFAITNNKKIQFKINYYKFKFFI